MPRKSLLEQIKHLDPCVGARRWLRSKSIKNLTPLQAWRACHDVSWMEWLIEQCMCPTKGVDQPSDLLTKKEILEVLRKLSPEKRNEVSYWRGISELRRLEKWRIYDRIVLLLGADGLRLLFPKPPRIPTVEQKKEWKKIEESEDSGSLGTGE